MYAFALPGCSRSQRAKGFLDLRSGLVPCCGLLAVLLGAALLFLSRSEQQVDTRGWKMTQFLDHLKSRGVQLHAVPAAKHGRCGDIFLTEDPSASWSSMQGKSMTVERVHQWQGSVWVGRAHPCIDQELPLAEWGPYGCRIGDFLLFGDERILQRIQEACRQ